MATLKTTKISFQDHLSLNAGQKYCRMLQGEHSAILSAFIKLLFVSKIFVLSIFEWPFKTGFTVYRNFLTLSNQMLSYIVLILYVPSTIFQLNRDWSSWVEPVLS